MSKSSSKLGEIKTLIGVAVLIVFGLVAAPSVVLAQSADPDTLVRLALDDSDTQSIAKDVSGNNNDGVISGATYTSEAVDGSKGSLEFDGIDDTVHLGVLDAKGTGITLAAWIRADSFTGNARDSRIISKASGVVADKHVFMLSTVKKGSSKDTVLRARVRIKGKTATFRASSGELEVGVWYHTAMTYDGKTIRLYVNGLEVDVASFPDGEGGPIDIDSDLDVAVGANPNGSNFFDGKIDDVIIALRVYTAAELLTIAERGTVGSYSAPIVNPETYGVTSEQQQLVAGLVDDVLSDGTDRR